MSWFYLALLAPLLYAFVNILDDNLLQFVYKSPYMAAAMAGLFGATPLISRFWIKADGLQLHLATPMILAGFCMTLFFFFYFRALQVEQPSVVIAMLNLVPATLPFLGYFLLHEHLGSLEISGFVLVLLASLLIAAIDIRKFKFNAALVPVLAAVIFIDITSLLSKYVYERAPFYTSYMYFAAGVGLGGLYFFFIMFYAKKRSDIRGLKKALGKVLPVFILAELLNLAAEFTLNLAISRGTLSVVKVIEGIQPVFVLLIAMAFYPLAPKYFREAATGQRTKKLALMSVAVTGLVLINIASR